MVRRAANKQKKSPVKKRAGPKAKKGPVKRLAAAKSKKYPTMSKIKRRAAAKQKLFFVHLMTAIRESRNISDFMEYYKTIRDLQPNMSDMKISILSTSMMACVTSPEFYKALEYMVDAIYKDIHF